MAAVVHPLVHEGAGNERGRSLLRAHEVDGGDHRYPPRPHEIVAPLGAGGMGDVYKARDTRSKRDVAIKVLPEAFSQDPDRLARLKREAELLATLNHPSIAAVGPLALSDALPITRQIVDALEAAHDKGVIHRDLKPANVKVTAEGKVKVLDSGLAKMLATEPVASSLTKSPTLSVHATYAAGGDGVRCDRRDSLARSGLDRAPGRDTRAPARAAALVL